MYGFALAPEDTAPCLAQLRSAAAHVERPAALGKLEITVTPRGRLTPEHVAGFAEFGVDRLVVTARHGVASTIDKAAAAVAGL